MAPLLVLRRGKMSEVCALCEKTEKVRCVERTSGNNPRGEKYEVLLCPVCDARTLDFAKLEEPEPPAEA